MSFVRRLLRRLVGGRAPAEEPDEGALTLLDALARAPAAALVVAALGLEDRKALRLVHTQLRDVVGEATTKLRAIIAVTAAAPVAVRPPTARRWPRLKGLTISGPDSAALEALGAETWSGLRMLYLDHTPGSVLDARGARALAAALRRMPALRALYLLKAKIPDASAGELFRADVAPRLRELTIVDAGLTPAAVRLLAATGWRLEELGLHSCSNLAGAGVAALVAAPTFALRRLALESCGLDAASLLSVADAPWPLETLDLSLNDFSDAAAAVAALPQRACLRRVRLTSCKLGAAAILRLAEAPWSLEALEIDDNDMSGAAAAAALAALSRHVGLRRLDVGVCSLRASGFKALVAAHWPALTFLRASFPKGFDGPPALGAAAFAGFPVLERLDLPSLPLGDAGVALLASRRWARLRRLDLFNCGMSDAGLAALARGEFPALEWLDLEENDFSAPPTLEDVRRWAPALEELVEAEVEGVDGAPIDGVVSEGDGWESE